MPARKGQRVDYYWIDGDGLSITVSELEALILIANGHLTASAAKRSRKSTHTIQTKMKHVLKRWDVRTAAGAVALAWRAGLLRPEHINPWRYGQSGDECPVVTHVRPPKA